MPVTDKTKPNENLGNHVIFSTLGDISSIPDATQSLLNATMGIGYKEKYGSMKMKLKDILYENELFQDELRTLKCELLDIYRDKDALLQKVLQFEGSLDSSGESDLDTQGDNVLRKEAAIVAGVRSYNKNGTIDNKVDEEPINDGDSNDKKICINIRPTPPKPTVTKAASNTKPKTTANRGRKSSSTASKATKGAHDNDSYDKEVVVVVGSKPTVKKTASKKSNNLDGTNLCKPAPAKKERKKPPPKQTKQQPSNKQAQQKQPRQTPPVASQSITFIQHAGQQAQLQIVQQDRSPTESQQFEVKPLNTDQQQQQITLLGQMSLPSDQIKYIQHVNLPVQTLDNSSMIVTNSTNQIQQQQNQIMTQQTHQIHFQIPQTSLAPVVETFQTPQSIITTQGNQINLGGHNYTIVSSPNNGTGNIMHHNQNQNQNQNQPQLSNQSSPPNHQQMMNQVVPMNTIMQSDISSISPQSIQDHSPEHQQQPQVVRQSQQLNLQHHQQQSHDNSQYHQHTVVHYQANHMLPVQMSQQQTQDEQACTDVVDFEQHLESRRIEQTALLIPDWESSDIFEADNIKFMVED